MQLANFIDGAFVSPHSGVYFDDINPATAEVIAQIPDSDERDVDDAVRAAKAAFPSWSRTTAAERSNLLGYPEGRCQLPFLRHGHPPPGKRSPYDR